MKKREDEEITDSEELVEGENCYYSPAL